MKRAKQGLGSFAALFLAGCGGDVRAPCDRLGMLCSDGDAVQRLDLKHSKGVTADLDGDGVLDLVSAAADVGLSIA